MQNYPRLAKLILLYPWFMALWNIIEYEYLRKRNVNGRKGCKSA